MFEAVESTTDRLIDAVSAMAVPNNWKGAFHCACCWELVFLRHGEHCSPHFAHFSSLAAQHCHLFCSNPSGGSGEHTPPRLLRIYNRAIEVWTEGFGWRPADQVLTGGPVMFPGTSHQGEFHELNPSEPLMTGRPYVLLGKPGEVPQEFTGFAKVFARLSAWVAWEFELPAHPSQTVRDWLRRAGHPWSPPSFLVRGTVEGARSEESEGVLTCPTASRILLEYSPPRGHSLAALPLGWRVMLDGKAVVEKYMANGHFQDQDAKLWFRPMKPGEWCLVPLGGEAAPLWLCAEGPCNRRDVPACGFQLFSAG